MEANLQQLIEKIKAEGVVEAKKKSQEIIQKSKKEAQKIIHTAKREAEKIKQQAEKDANQEINNAEAAIQQSMRDVILTVREKLIKLFDAVLKRNISESMAPEFLKDLIIGIINKWTPGEEESFEVLVNKEDKQELEKLLFSQLREEAKKEIEIKVSENITKGFRIGLKGENVYYDFSDESIAESLKELTTPTVTKILNK